MLTKNNWKTATKKDVINKDLWQELISVSHGLNIKSHWVKGHSDNEMNNKVDKIAVECLKRGV